MGAEITALDSIYNDNFGGAHLLELRRELQLDSRSMRIAVESPCCRIDTSALETAEGDISFGGLAVVCASENPPRFFKHKS